jgi:hypothetical protein
MLSLLAAMSLILASEPSAVATTVSTANTTPPAEGSEALKTGETRTKMVCRMETPTGTRFAKRVCLSEADFNARQDDAYKGMRGLQTHAPTCCATSGN